jgi:DNA-binding FadR family transcriptional regulator
MAQPRSRSQMEVVPRRHAADHVFEQLAGAVLRKELAPGSPLPAERVLSERFGVSPLITRQAIHRLADVGLVRVRQGGATLILDPDEATDVRVIALLYGESARSGGYAKPSARDAADVLEKQVLQGFCLLDVAARRAGADERRALAAIVDELATSPSPADAFAAFDEKFWRALALAGKNRIYRLEVAWWFEVLVGRPEMPAAPIAARVAFYQEIARRLVAHTDAAGFYRAAMEPVLAALHGTTPRKLPPAARRAATARGARRS